MQPAYYHHAPGPDVLDLHSHTPATSSPTLAEANRLAAQAVPAPTGYHIPVGVGASVAPSSELADGRRAGEGGSSATWTSSSGEGLGGYSDLDEVQDRFHFVDEYNRLAKKVCLCEKERERGGERRWSSYWSWYRS